MNTSVSGVLNKLLIQEEGVGVETRAEPGLFSVRAFGVRISLLAVECSYGEDPAFGVRCNCVTPPSAMAQQCMPYLGRHQRLATDASLIIKA